MSPSLNHDMYRIIFSYLPHIFLQETIRLINKPFNELMIEDEFFKDYFKCKIQQMMKKPEHNPHHYIEGGSSIQTELDSFYMPYLLGTTKDYRKAFHELKQNLEKKIEENLNERRKVALKPNVPTKEDHLDYQHFEEIKSKITDKHMEPLKGVDLFPTSCTEGQKTNHRKLVLAGEGGVGKTSTIEYLSYGRMREYMNVPFETCYVSYNFGTERVCHFALWDTAGQEEYTRLRLLSYPETDVFCICFSTVSTQSFLQIPKWISEITQIMPHTPIILVGCKIDLRTNPTILKTLKFRHFGKPISFSEGEQMARSAGCCTYIETSALTGEGNMVDFAEIAAKSIIYGLQPSLLSNKKKNCELM